MCVASLRQRVALACLHVMTKVTVERARCYSSVVHDRSILGKGLCVLVPNKPVVSASSADAESEPPAPVVDNLPMGVLMWRLRAMDRVDCLLRSVKQLVFGTITLLHAKHLKLAYHYQVCGGMVPTWCESLRICDRGFCGGVYHRVVFLESASLCLS